MEYEVKIHSKGFRPYGGAARGFYSKAPEVMIAGPAETGKTYTALYKLHVVAAAYPGAQLAIIRKTYKSAYTSVLETYWHKVVGGEGRGVERYGGHRPEWFTYPNGSRIWCGGMDNPDKVLSSERDLIFVNQAEELDIAEWEILLTRCTGRAGNVPWAQLLGDCNPGPPHHWIRERTSFKQYGTFFESRHIENPVLYDQLTGQVTEQGKRTMAILESLTGIRKDRLLYGKWVQAEGLIWEDWDETINLIDEEQAPVQFKKFTASQDWGFTEPGVLGVWGHDEDNRMYLIRQVFKTKRTSSWWTEAAVQANAWVYGRYGRWIELIACDPARPEYIADYNNAVNNEVLVKKYGIEACRLRADQAPNAILPGLDRVNDRIKVQEDGKPRLFIVRDNLVEIDQDLRYNKKPYSTEQEILEYVWNDKSKKEVPVQKNDHGCDMLRYGVAKEDGIGDDIIRDPASELVDVEDEVYGYDVEEKELLIPRTTRRRIFGRDRRF